LQHTRNVEDFDLVEEHHGERTSTGTHARSIAEPD
jgi:hypothetical protein